MAQLYSMIDELSLRAILRGRRGPELVSVPPLYAEQPVGELCPVMHERRALPRLTRVLVGQCRPAASLGAPLFWPLELIDISQNGLCVRLARRFEPNTLLSVCLHGADEGVHCRPLARVCWIANSYAQCILGCSWAPELSHEEVAALLEPARSEPAASPIAALEQRHFVKSKAPLDLARAALVRKPAGTLRLRRRHPC
jgi:hypothetical protein